MFMIVYHGSTQVVENPDVEHSFRNLDFGKGFYVTSMQQQAQKWALRKAALNDCSKSIVNVYNLNDEVILQLRCKTFADNLSEWLDFVCACRDEKDDYNAFDVIIGKVADDQVYRVVNMYFRGFWDKSRAIEEMKIYPNYDQIAFIYQYAIDKALSFSHFYEVKHD